MPSPVRVLVYAPFSFTGRGPAESCANIVAGFPTHAVTTEVFGARFRRRMPGQVRLRPSLPPIGRQLPWRLVSAQALARLDRDFVRALRVCEPARTVAWFWPDPPVELVEEARRLGIVTVREMINSTCAVSGPILDAAYDRLDLAPSHGITADKIAVETRELAAYDYYFASNAEVETSLSALGVEPHQILSTTFGWTPSRFEAPTSVPRRRRPRVLFVGTLSVRKGVPELLDAWRKAGVDANLQLAGAVTQELAALVHERAADDDVELLGYVEDVGSLFHGADVFAFPTHEEGGPQVTYEAAGCGLPVITTPMGAARLVETEVNGVVVAPGAVEELSEAIRLLVEDPGLRELYGASARQRAAEFTYERVGAQRCSLLLETLQRR